MLRRAASCLLLSLLAAAAPAAELFYMDRDAFNNAYVGPVGPLVLSGEIVEGDYARLLARIAEDPSRFLDEDKLILASSDGNAAEAMKIAKLLQSLYTKVVVGPLTGRCAGACFLIYVAAVERGTDGEQLLGAHRPGLAGSEWIALSTTEAALREDALQTPVRAFLVANEVPADLIETLFGHLPTDAYWLSESDEASLGAKSPSFRKFLAKNCGWNDSLEHAVFSAKGLDDLKSLTACRARVTRPEAKKALAQALKEQASAQAPGAPAISKTALVSASVAARVGAGAGAGDSTSTSTSASTSTVDAPVAPTAAPSVKHHSRKVKRHRPVRQVDDLADAKVPAHAAQQVGVDGGHAVPLSQ
jgi:hypothetical protein